MGNGIKNDRISIIGTGSIGKALGTLLLKKGYEIVYGSRNPANGHNLPGIEHNKATVKTIGEAASASDVIIIAVPYPALEETIPAIALWAASKVIVDATNPPLPCLLKDALSLHWVRKRPPVAGWHRCYPTATWPGPLTTLRMSSF